MSDPFDGLISDGASGAMLGFAAMARTRDARLEAMRDERQTREQQNLQFLIQMDSSDRQDGLQRQQLGMQQAASDRAFALQREESSFARLNNVLGRQLQLAEVESKERQQAFENVLRAQQFGLQTRLQSAQLKQVESQSRQALKAEQFKDFLGEFSVLESEMMHGDGRAKAAAALALNALVKKNTGVLGVDPEFAAKVGQVNALASDLSTGYFKLLDDADPAIRAGDLEQAINDVDPADGLDADETQIVSVMLEGFRFKAPAGDVAGRRAELENHLATRVPGESGRAVAAGFAERLFRDTNAATKYFEMADRGAFARPLSTDEVADIKAFRNELKAEEMQIVSALRDSGMSPSERGQIMAAEQRKNSLALEQYALRLKGAQDPEGIGHLKGSNVMTKEATVAAIMGSQRRPEAPWKKVARVSDRAGAVLELSNPPAMVGRGIRLAAGAAKGWYDDEVLRYEIDKFYQDHVDPVRLGNGATVGDPNAMVAWSAAADAIAKKFGGQYSETAIKEALYYGKHVPTWVSEDRALTPVAMRVVPGYAPGLFETPSEAIRRSLIAQYQAQQSQAYAGATTRANQLMGGAAPAGGVDALFNPQQ